ncbi:MAG: excinuclease ABC subunit UvrA [Candidatus Saccharimonas aalborgensis]|uniref:UvrABC system protein A n=1 Tax=Candidatus Saccharimonas aalborgensis TaxID=1332188 RepID=R4PM59_9BACT|nr:excinuclease ABC subunit UvrA [Candidatus Saccharimonas aalborgensis]AGL61959.1 excinuclease ABC (subunit A) [Candidatus Saccharimonas aalborgensis]QQS68491.1 MAG: excinuclease ABC subunit UvrA [Candidatus Saccharibacteria bacterium]QQS70781.1 MAG: excinuclease ABC subunit UvrA [Candidatus Saccharibacteria bacterium]
MSEVIRVRGAREHNLKNVDVEIPRDQLVVVTGLSGSGKSSLVFDTIYAEGQRRYVESLSSYARQFLGIMDKPDVDSIDGLSPAISIDQKSTSRNPRSTVATVTEIYDYLRLLYARIGVPHCPVCAKAVHRRTPQAIIDEIMKLPEGSKLLILAPIVNQKKGEFAHIPEQYRRLGFARVRVDGVVYALDEFPELQKSFKHDIEVVVDRLVLRQDAVSRVTQSTEQALDIAGGVVQLLDADSDTLHTFSQRYACIDHPGEDIPELEPRLFSFNAPQGACPVCTGLGSRLEIDPDLVFNPNLTIAEGAIRPYNRVNSDAWYMKRLATVAEAHGFSVQVPVKQLHPDDLQKVLYGTGSQKYRITLNGGRYYDSTYEGVIPNLERRHKETESEFMRKDIERFMRERECHACHGARLKPVVLAVTVHDLSIMDICNLGVDDAIDLFNALKLTDDEMVIAKLILKEIMARLGFMSNVGLSYLELSRAANTLSGGEAQRIRLATQIGSGLQGVLYVLDEPSIGLHQRDNDRLIGTLKHLRDLGNSVLVVEHDEDTIRHADYLVDVGPGAGVHGGQIVAHGTPKEVAENPASITGKYLSGKETIPLPRTRRKLQKDRAVTIRGAKENNLKNLDVVFPLGILTVVTGVSGSGKSTLVNDILAKELSARLHRAQEVPGAHENIEGIEHLDKAIVIDQSAIGRTPRSNPATYTGVFTPIRELFAGTPEANIRGYKAGRFSFNVKGGRCENCQGDGVIKIEMHFLPDVYVTCDECKGKRYNREALEIKYKGVTISDVLDMTVEQACEFFANVPSIARKLDTLNEVGLGYIKLGQPATTFSGGEAQRIKLASELSRRSTGKTLYILDEPTTGLHTHDVKKLLEILQKLVEGGNTMIIIEHNLEVIKCADHIVDLGPEGGQGGGTIVAQGTPEEIAKIPASFTGKYLKKML